VPARRSSIRQRLGPGFDPFGQLAEGAFAGSVSNLMSDGEYKRDRPIDYLKYGHNS
jgi:hypothetical protein